MKYIRTKEGIYELTNKEISVGFDVYHYVKGKDTPVDSKDIIKQAYTIEELCDGYIFKDTRANVLHFAQKGKEDGIFILGAALFSETLRYFIETDKGLIYVAKMNEKGELELL